MEKYLDITKSVIISSPAGSGKTEKLARRYISLLLGGSEIEKILAITFTEKAAAEMKDRILSIIEKEHPDLFLKIREKMPLMRISTIHAFCLKLLKRFSMELGIDPSLDVLDEFAASLLWSESVYEALIEEKDNPELFYEMMKTRGIRGWDILYRTLNELHSKRPHPELIIKEGHPVDGDEEKRILNLYSRCLKHYSEKKKERHLVDYDDLELLAYEALNSNPDWMNILYSFDEHTDHILIDEFQDISSLQWKIIDKLTEEWRSGRGSKRESGKTPTVFLVGDEKQSIYLFRGANVSLFHEAKKRLSVWLGDEYLFEEIKENYRSLPAITEFVNSLFKRLMQPSEFESWRTRYAHFVATRQGDGHVELILLDSCENTKDSREKEASILVKRIQSLVNKYEIYDEDKIRSCIYGDMAILLRRRTHLSILEDALRRHNIPFVILKGIGFYDEPEVALLRELLSFLIDTKDDFSLFCILRSPLFNIDYKTLFNIIDNKVGISLFEKLQNTIPLNPTLIKDEEEDIMAHRLYKAYNLISRWIERIESLPLAVLLEEILSDTNGWQYFWEKQRYVNIKKFLRLIEQFDSRGLSLLEIREKLIKARQGEEPKANINTEGMNAVKIMTVHAAKGLEFPIVFLPSLEEDNTPKSKSIVIDEEDGSIFIAYEEDSNKRKKREIFQKRKEKEIEEEKRLFYVSVTRAKDFLCMLGSQKKDEKPTGRLAYIVENLEHISSLKVINESELNNFYSVSASKSIIPEESSEHYVSGPLYTKPLLYEPRLKWKDVTEEIDIKAKHGHDWILLGKVFHKLFEEISMGMLDTDRIEKRARTLLRLEKYDKNGLNNIINIIKSDFDKLSESGYIKDIISFRKDSYVELPFIYQKGKTIFRGRIDRIILKDNIAYIYDYKTYPVEKRELSDLKEKYRFQMEIYREAIEKLLKLKAKSFLFFTHIPLIVEV
ncbi:MAG: UvrD-helicase domain-containing protein [Nitrospirae bacterium]|nr:UvrD-helicase domain-containing protein [Nitrospirota bacterium]